MVQDRAMCFSPFTPLQETSSGQQSLHSQLPNRCPVCPARPTSADAGLVLISIKASSIKGLWAQRFGRKSLVEKQALYRETPKFSFPETGTSISGFEALQAQEHHQACSSCSKFHLLPTQQAKNTVLPDGCLEKASPYTGFSQACDKAAAQSSNWKKGDGCRLRAPWVA